MTVDKIIPADYEAPLDLLTARVVLITGAAEGIGRCLAIQAAGRGATVVLLDRNVKKLEQVYDEIEQNGGPQPAIYPMNLEGATPQDYLELANSLQDNFGRLDGLVHNAAQLGRPAPLDQYDIESWYKTLQTNLNAPFMLTRFCLPLLRQSASASVIFTSDTVGRRGKAYWGAYAVSKAGLEGLMQLLAAELEDTSRVRVNSLDPGPVQTGLRRSAYPAEDPRQHPQPEQVVGAFLYLLGPESKRLHGQSLTVEAKSLMAETQVL